MEAAIPHTDTGSYRDDMLAVLRGWVALFTGPMAPVLRSVIGAMAHDDVLLSAFRTDVIGWRKEQMAALLARGVTRGEDDVLVPLVAPPHAPYYSR